MKYLYKREDDGSLFSWNSKSNHLTDSSGKRISLGNKISWGPQQMEQTFKPGRSPTTLKIILGHACNYDCSYCLQKDLGNPKERNKNENLPSFFKSVEKNLDLSNLGQIQLWGGEPLLYWKDCVEIIDRYDREGLKVLLVTNGSILRDKHIEYINKLKCTVNIVISHDGPGHKELRGVDPLEKKRTIDTLKLADKLGVQYNFSSVITSSNYDTRKIEDWFYNKMIEHGLDCRGLAMAVGTSYDMELGGAEGGMPEYVIQGDQLEVFDKSFRESLERQYQYMISKGFDENQIPISAKDESKRDLMSVGYFDFLDAESVIDMAFRIASSMPVTKTSNCGANRSDVLTVDLNNTIKPCAHTDGRFDSGTIDNIDNVKLRKIVERTPCHECRVFSLCKGGCPLDIHTEHFKLNCDIQKVWYGAILDYALKFLLKTNVVRMDSGLDLQNI